MWVSLQTFPFEWNGFKKDMGYLPRPKSSVGSVYTGRTLAVYRLEEQCMVNMVNCHRSRLWLLSGWYTRGPVYHVSVCQCVISVLQYTLNTLEFHLGKYLEIGLKFDLKKHCDRTGEGAFYFKGRGAPILFYGWRIQTGIFLACRKEKNKK